MNANNLLKLLDDNSVGYVRVCGVDTAEYELPNPATSPHRRVVVDEYHDMTPEMFDDDSPILTDDQVTKRVDITRRTFTAAVLTLTRLAWYPHKITPRGGGMFVSHLHADDICNHAADQFAKFAQHPRYDGEKVKIDVIYADVFVSVLFVAEDYTHYIHGWMETLIATTSTGA